MKPKTKSFRKNKKRLSKKARKTKKMVGGLNPTFLVTVLLVCSLLFHYYHLYDKDKRFIESLNTLIKYSKRNGIILFDPNLELQKMMNDKEFRAFLSGISLRPLELKKPSLSIADVASGLVEGEGNDPMIPSNTMILEKFEDNLMKLSLRTRERMKNDFLKAFEDFLKKNEHIRSNLNEIILPENTTLESLFNRIAIAFGVK